MTTYDAGRARLRKPAATLRKAAAGLATFLVAGLVAVVVPASPAAAAPGDISTVAGPLPDVVGLDEAGGALLVSQAAPGLVRRVAAGVTTTLAGGGTIPLGDGGPASAAAIDGPEAVALDSAGNLFVADRGNFRVRRVAAGADGVVNGGPGEVVVTVLGTGTAGFTGDGGPAASAQIGRPDRMAFDSAGALLLSDEENRRVRRVLPGADGLVDGDADETVDTVVGNGTAGPTGDGGAATAAGVSPRALAFDAAGRLYVGGGNLVRRVVPGANGVVDGQPDEIIATFAGGGTLPPGPSNPGEGAAATDVALDNVYSLAFDGAGNLFVASTDIDVRQHVLRVTPAGVLTAVVGAGPSSGTGAGDGGPARSAELSWPFGLAFDGAGNLYVGELTGHRVRKVVPGADGLLTGAADEVISRFAGTGLPGTGGDGGPAAAAPVDSPAGLGARGADVYLADRANGRVRRVDASGTITTVAGGGVGDGLPATSAKLSDPRGVVADGAGNVYVADCGNSRVRRIDPGGVISTLLGPLPCPAGLHLVSSGPAAGTLYVAVAGGHRVVKRAPSGAVTTVAGTGIPGFGGDGAAAVSASLNGPAGVHVDAAGNVFIADTRNNRIRRVDAASGVVTTVAGDGNALFGTLGGVPATSTAVAGPEDVVVDAAGNLIIAETLFSRLRRVDPSGTISTIAGNGIPAYGGDGGPAASAVISSPSQLDLDASGALLFTDRGNARVRRIEAGTPPVPPVSDRIGCGSVLTKDTVLTADIGPCRSDGLVVGKDGIRLNLNGYRVFGTAGDNSTVGIRLFGRAGVTVSGGSRNGQQGTVSGFDAGVAIIGGSSNVVEGLKARDNIGFEIYGDGIATFFSSSNVIRDNLLLNNGMYDGIGILGIGTRGNVVQRNTVMASTAQGEVVGGGTGIVLTPFLSEGLPREQSIFDNRVLDNLVQGNDNSGISNISNVNGVIRGNTVRENGRLRNAFPSNGIGIQNLRSAPRDTHVLVENNLVMGNGSIDGRFPASGDGINITSTHNRVVGNRVDNNLLDGISVVADHNEVDGNRLRGNGRDGIIVTSHDNLVSGNRVQGSRASGIKAELGSSGNRFVANDASGNAKQVVDFESQYFQADLVDANAEFSEDPFLFTFDCGTNVWADNVWGSGGFFPDPARSDPDAGVLIEEACTTLTAADAAVVAVASAEGVRAVDGPRPERPPSAEVDVPGRERGWIRRDG